MHRSQILKTANAQKIFDFIIIGGGATGLGSALDAALRGYSVLLLEQYDFAKSTSSKSTKLVHGGVRYLEQGDLGLVFEALRERAFILKNAPQISNIQEFVILCDSFFQKWYYYLGLKIYDLLSLKGRIGSTQFLSKKAVQERLPNADPTQYKAGGISYFDGAFDDACLAIQIAKHASKNGAILLNYMKLTTFIQHQHQVTGVQTTCQLTGESFTFEARCVLNACGVNTEDILKKNHLKSSLSITASKGSHIVVDQKFLGNKALLVPKTKDGRVLYAIPWQGKTLIGTTDEPVNIKEITPHVSPQEIAFMMEHFNAYSTNKIQKSDITAVFSGLRPLVTQNDTLSTKEMSRKHQIENSTPGLLSIMGGKWTTYRSMAQSFIDAAEVHVEFPHRPSRTQSYSLKPLGSPQNLYLNTQNKIDQQTYHPPLDFDLNTFIHPKYPYTYNHVLKALQQEFAQKAEDILARRTRLLFLDAAAAIEAAPGVIQLMAHYFGKDAQWQAEELQDFKNEAQKYLPE